MATEENKFEALLDLTCYTFIKLPPLNLAKFTQMVEIKSHDVWE